MDIDADDNRGASAPRENGVSNMDDDIDGDSLGDLVNQWEAIVLDAESDGEDESFNIDENEEEDLTDDELEYDSDEDYEAMRPLGSVVLKPKGWVPPNDSGATLGEESKALLFWRESENSFSDWKIKVVTETEELENATIYNVHRVALAMGPKKSGYFEALLKSDSFSESSECMNTVKLPEELAAHVPDFLDYMYFNVIINFENWKPMMCLANYFLVPKLTEDVMRFVETDMYNLEHMEDYLSEFDDINDVMTMRIFPKATRVCAEMIRSIEVDSSLLKLISPAMFLYIISTLGHIKRFTRINKKDLRHVCCLVVGYLEHIEDESYFHALSDSMSWAFFFGSDNEIITGQWALDLLQLMRRKGWENDWFSIVCIASLRNYLLYGKDPTFALIYRVVKEVPNDIAASLIREALSEKGDNEQQGTAGGLRFDITLFRNGQRLSWGERELLVVSSIETISELKERLALELGAEGRTNLHCWMHLFHNNIKMDDAETVSSYQLSPDDDLIEVEWGVY